MRKLFGKGRRHEVAPSVDEQDQLVIEQMRSLGWDMSSERLVENFLYFPNREAADSASTQLTADGYEVTVAPSAQGGGWLNQANRRFVVTIDAIRRQRATLTAIAASHGGEYDGWGAPE